MKLIILDGVDNSGKTSTAKMLQRWFDKKGIEVGSVHFPSDIICRGELFKKVAHNPSEQTKQDFIEEVVEEEIAALFSLLKSGFEYIIVDRFLFSSLMFQGEEDDTRDFIFQRYERMFKFLGIDGTDVRHFIFTAKVADDNEETNETKKIFDSRAVQTEQRVWQLLELLKLRDIDNAYLTCHNVCEIDNIGRQGFGHSHTDEELDMLTISRCATIVKWIQEGER